MKIAIFGKQFNKSFHESCLLLFNQLEKYNAQIIMYKPFYDFLVSELDIKINVDDFFELRAELGGVNLLLSIGGDGTILEAVSFIRDTSIPVVGINSGRLGFLSEISKDDIVTSIDNLFKGNYRIKSVDLLKVETSNNLFGEKNYALNEFSVHRRDNASMITIHCYLDGELLNSYWADGLIVATSVGSTAYSLSLGGPIIHSQSPSLIITPIAPHNLSVRPLVLPNNMKIKIKVEGRSNKYLATLDYRSEIFEKSIEFNIAKADFSIYMIDLPGVSFNTTLINKLMWGADKRN